jgi:hypothetical protein
MSTQIEVRPEIADKLSTIAKARGISLDELLKQILDDLERPQSAVTEPSMEEYERDMDALAEDLEHLPIGYEGDYSREDIYLDHF